MLAPFLPLFAGCNMMINLGSALGDFAEPYLGRRYSILFYTLLLTMIAAPVLSTLRLSGIVALYSKSEKLLVESVTSGPGCRQDLTRAPFDFSPMSWALW